MDQARDGGLREQCDDENKEDGDGCSATCQYEAGFNCKEKDGKSTCSKVPQIPNLRVLSTRPLYPGHRPFVPNRNTNPKYSR